MVSPSAAVKELNELIFSKVWNEVRSEYRVNILLRSVNERFLSGSALIGSTLIRLPTSEQFLVFVTPTKLLFSGIVANKPNTWVNCEDILNNEWVNFYLYQRNGKVVPRKYMYMMQLNTGKTILAVARKGCVNILSMAELNYTYLTIYKDSNMTNEVTCKSWWIDPANPITGATGLLAHINQCKSLNNDGTFILINGIEWDNDNTDYMFNPNDVVEVILDKNVIGSYVVNVSNSTTGYHSPNFNKHREIIHCPKSLNPLNRLLTINTCDLTIRDMTNKQGLYFHYTDPVSVSQITHNDISIDTDVLDAFRDYLGTEQVELKVRIRLHENNNVLMNVISYISYLYQCDDEEIVRHLRGEMDVHLDFWKATELEVNPYIQMMFNSPNDTSSSVLASYIEGIGYLTICQLLANNLFTTQIVNNAQHTFTIRKPFAYRGLSVVPHVYLPSGTKINNSKIDYVQDAESIILTISDLVYLTPGTLSIELILHGDYRPYIFTPTTFSPSTIVNYLEVDLYEEIDLPAPVTGYQYTTDKKYRKIIPVSGTVMLYPTSDGRLEIVFGMSLYDKKIIIQPKYMYYHKSENISTITNDKLTITTDMMRIDHDANPIAQFGYEACRVYLNGHRLIKDIDFTDIPIHNENGYTGKTEIVITSMEYFSSVGNNEIEVITHSNVLVSDEVSYTYDNKISYDNTLTVWRDGLSKATTFGKLNSLAIDHGSYIDPNVNIANGKPAYLETYIPKVMQQILSGYTFTIDIARLIAISNYFNRLENPIPSPIVMEAGSYRIYSPYLHAIIRDVCTGVKEVVDDPNDNAFLLQFSEYQFLKDRDPTLNGSSKINRNFVDIYPSYSRWTVPNTRTYRLLHRLVSLVHADRITFGDIVDG